MATKKDTETSAAQGTPGEGRFYLPPSEASKDDTAPEPAGPEGRFYVSSEGDKDGESLAENPVEQAGVQAGEPPTKDEVKAAKAEAKAVDSGGPVATADPAAETVQPDPVAAAGELAQEPPPESVKAPPKKAAKKAAKKATRS